MTRDERLAAQKYLEELHLENGHYVKFRCAGTVALAGEFSQKELLEICNLIEGAPDAAS